MNRDVGNPGITKQNYNLIHSIVEDEMRSGTASAVQGKEPANVLEEINGTMSKLIHRLDMIHDKLFYTHASLFGAPGEIPVSNTGPAEPACFFEYLDQQMMSLTNEVSKLENIADSFGDKLNG